MEIFKLNAFSKEPKNGISREIVEYANSLQNGSKKKLLTKKRCF